MARQFFDSSGAQQAGAPPAFAMPRHVLPHEPERFAGAGAPPPDLSKAWTEMQAGRAAPSEMMRARSSNGGWSAEFDGVAQIAQPAGQQQNMPMQSNCECSPAIQSPFSSYVPRDLETRRYMRIH